MGGPVQGALEAVEAGQRDAGRRAQDLGQEGGGAARDDGDEGEAGGQRSQQRRHARERAGRRRVLDDGRQRPVEVEEQRAAIRLGRQRLQEGREARRGVARCGQRQEDATVVVVLEARSAPITTTTSVPVTPLTGVAVEIGSTWVGWTPMVVAMDAAASCWPAA